jgi:hypothetical protein
MTGGLVTAKFESADSRLDASQFHELNVRFYEGFHKDFILTRLGLLCWQNEAPEAVEKVLADGTVWGELKLTIDPEDGFVDTLRRNAELELVALRQHAAEVLFRLFWVHAHREPCIWLALARLRNPGDLKHAAEQYLRGELWSGEDERTTLWGSSAVLEDGHPREARLGESADAVALWIVTAAEAVRDAPLYNAYKHGLAVVTNEAFNVTLGATAESPDPLVMQAGSGFSYIERVRDEPNRCYRWQFVRAVPVCQ